MDVLFFGALDDDDDALVEFAIGGLANLFTGGPRVLSLCLDERQDAAETNRRLRSLMALLDRPLKPGRNDVILAGALVCLTAVVRLRRFDETLSSLGLSPSLDRLLASSSSSLVSNNHLTLLRQIWP